MQESSQPVLLVSLNDPNVKNELRILFREEIETFFKKTAFLKKVPAEQEVLLNVKECSEFIKLSIPSIYRLCGEKKLPSYKKSGKLLFSKKELIKWAHEGRRETIEEIEESAERHLSQLKPKT